MSTHNIPYQCRKENHPKLFQIQSCLQLWDFFPRDSRTSSKTALVKKPSVFEPLKFYCTYFLMCLYFFFPSLSQNTSVKSICLANNAKYIIGLRK